MVPYSESGNCPFGLRIGPLVWFSVDCKPERFYKGLFVVEEDDGGLSGLFYDDFMSEDAKKSTTWLGENWSSYARELMSVTDPMDVVLIDGMSSEDFKTKAWRMCTNSNYDVEDLKGDPNIPVVTKLDIHMRRVIEACFRYVLYKKEPNVRVSELARSLRELADELYEEAANIEKGIFFSSTQVEVKTVVLQRALLHIRD